MIYDALDTQRIDHEPPAFARFTDGLTGQVYSHEAIAHDGYVVHTWTIHLGPEQWRSFFKISQPN